MDDSLKFLDMSGAVDRARKVGKVEWVQRPWHLLENCMSFPAPYKIPALEHVTMTPHMKFSTANHTQSTEFSTLMKYIDGMGLRVSL